jgi:mitogen-activated protein kinase 7
MGDLTGRKVFKVFNQDFTVDERYTVTKELGQGAYGIVWYDVRSSFHRSS